MTPSVAKKGSKVVAPAARGRIALSARKSLQRQVSRNRISAYVRTPLSAGHRAVDPLAAVSSGVAARFVRLLGTLAGSSAVHAGVVGLGVFIGGLNLGNHEPVRQTVAIEVREKPPAPPEAKAPEEAPKAPQPTTPPPPVRPKAPPVAKQAPPPPDKAPEPPSNRPPPRVVGLSLDSTTEGGAGASFAVGNTREGITEKRAVAAKDLAPAGEGLPTTEPDPGAAPGTNRVASRIPVAGVKYAPPSRKRPSKPPYPAVLKVQGVEADVTVMVNLDATGKVMKVKIIKDAAYPEFNEAARVAATSEEFEPATKDGVPIPYTLSFTYRFRLEDQ